MQGNEKDSGSTAGKDTTLLPDAGGPVDPEERNRRAEDIRASGGEQEPFKPEALGAGSDAGPANRPPQRVIAYPQRPPSAGWCRKARRQRRPGKSPNNSSGVSNRVMRPGLTCYPGGETGSTSGAAGHGFPAGMGDRSVPGVSGAHKYTGGAGNVLPAAGSRRVSDTKGGCGEYCLPPYRPWDAKVKSAKDLLLKILTPFRLFYRKRVCLKVLRNATREVPPAARTRVLKVAVKSRPRIVVDTNVIMGGLINPSKASGRLLGIWLEGKVDVVVSPALLDEYLCIFNKMRFGPKEALARREEAMKKLLRHENLTLVETELKLHLVEKDPSDNRLIECAVAGGADYIISQDRHLLAIGEYSGIKIMRAHAFLLQEYPEGRS
ncbi:MAG: putative toxin-antitoxin system toxin component, PIN family [Bacillota bacterium]